MAHFEPVALARDAVTKYATIVESEIRQKIVVHDKCKKDDYYDGGEKDCTELGLLLLLAVFSFVEFTST